jgi:3-dehydroquinate dehydratase/shikimate dehydrogenase
VIGDPIAQSKSPLIHNAAYRKLGLNAVYLPIRIPQDRLLESLKELERLQVAGYSVTIPHKEGVLQYVDQMDEATDLMGAANTLFKRDGQWCATNTDAPAAVSAIQDGLRKAGNIPELAARKVLILGAGGAARAVGHALLQHGAVVTLTNRSRDRGKSLASELGCQFTSWENRGSEICDVLVNCTSVGMHPNVDESPFEQHWLSDSALVFDTVYNPEQTLLLKQARDRGCPTVSGVEMFIRQAALQFGLFTGYEAPVEYMAETLRRSNAAARTIVSSDQTGG